MASNKYDITYYLRRTPTVTLQRIANEIRRTRSVTTSTAVSSARYAMARVAEKAEKIIVREPIVGVDAIVEDVADTMVGLDVGAKVEGIKDARIALSASVRVEEHVEEGT